MTTVLEILAKGMRRYWQDSQGTAAVIFALVLPVLIGGAGMAVDVAQAYNVQTRLSNALDKAALAAANTAGSEEELRTRMENFFYANYPDDRIGTPFEVTLTVLNDGNRIEVSAKSQVDTRFMRLFGHDTMEVGSYSVVTRELAGIEVALVLDVTGSMSGTRIEALKTAATDFINIMFERVSDPEYIKIGIVPYAQSVNVGPYGWGLDLDGNPYGMRFIDQPASDDFITPTSNIVYDTSNSLQWHGCVLARPWPDDTNDGPGNWDMYRWPRQCTRYRWGVCDRWREDPNYSCPTDRIVPMTNIQNVLLTAIANLQTGGNTYGNIGMVWGFRLISPEEPFTEGAPYEEARWRKVILMMTDGDNTMNGTYSVYGETANHSITAADLDVRLEEVCTNAKAEGIQIYTVTFESGITEATRDYYRRCASQSTMYYNAPTNEELVAAFQDIASQLAQLHISQ